MPFGIPGYMEMIIIGIIAVLLFGNRLPKVARSVGSSFVEFKRGLSGVSEELKSAKDSVDDAVKISHAEITK